MEPRNPNFFPTWPGSTVEMMAGPWKTSGAAAQGCDFRAVLEAMD